MDAQSQLSGKRIHLTIQQELGAAPSTPIFTAGVKHNHLHGLCHKVLLKCAAYKVDFSTK